MRGPSEASSHGQFYDALVASQSVLLVLAAIVALVAVIAAAVFAFVRTRELLRRFRQFGATVDEALAVVSARAELVAERAGALGPGELEPALARLHASRARLAVLLAAVDDVRAAVASVTGVRPTK